jgi:hypothetical protein
VAGASEYSASVVPPEKRRFSILEEARTSRAPQETRPEMTEGEKHMNRRRKNQFKESLDAKREALATAAKQPKQEPEWEPETPEIRAELAKEQERRRVAERKVRELQSPRRTFAELIRTNKRRKAPWK